MKTEKKEEEERRVRGKGWGEGERTCDSSTYSSTQAADMHSQHWDTREQDWTPPPYTDKNNHTGGLLQSQRALEDGQGFTGFQLQWKHCRKQLDSLHSRSAEDICFVPHIHEGISIIYNHMYLYYININHITCDNILLPLEVLFMNNHLFT